MMNRIKTDHFFQNPEKNVPTPTSTQNSAWNVNQNEARKMTEKEEFKWHASHFNALRNLLDLIFTFNKM